MFIPNYIVFDKRLKPGHKYTYGYLLILAQAQEDMPPGKCWVTQRSLAPQLGVSDTTVLNHLKKLRATGVIETETFSLGTEVTLVGEAAKA